MGKQSLARKGRSARFDLLLVFCSTEKTRPLHQQKSNLDSGFVSVHGLLKHPRSDEHGQVTKESESAANYTLERVTGFEPATCSLGSYHSAN